MFNRSQLYRSMSSVFGYYCESHIFDVIENRVFPTKHKSVLATQILGTQSLLFAGDEENSRLFSDNLTAYNYDIDSLRASNFDIEDE